MADDYSFDPTDPITKLLQGQRFRSTPVQTPMGGNPLAATPARYLDRFRIPTGFPEGVPRTTQPSMMPQPPQQSYQPSEMMKPQRSDIAVEPGDVAKSIGKIGGKDSIGDTVKSAKDRADAVMRSLGLPPMPNGGEPMDENIRTPPYFGKGTFTKRAMTPFEGPDTGDVNPNAPGVPRGYFARLRHSETSDDDNAVNKATRATGPYQFLQGTWGSLMKDNPNLTWEGFYSPSKHLDQHEAAMKAYTDKSMGLLTKQLGRSPTPGELYSLHFFGHSGGISFMQNLDKPLKDTVATPEVLRVNPWLKSYANKPGRELLGRLDQMIGGE